jgi:hypothetical protein
MSNFPNDFDDDTTLPPINDNIQDLGAEAINALRDAMFNVEQYLGLGGAGTTGSISERLGISLEPDGTVKPSAIASLGLVTLPITNDQISNSAEIPESKLKLDHRTQDLFNYIQDLSNSINTSFGWISLTGIKLEPHLLGAIYRHTLNQIDVSNDPNQYLKNKFNALRDNHDSYTLINDINNEFLHHQLADGSVENNVQLITTIDGSTYPSNYGHTSSGIWLNTSRFAVIPQTAVDLQKFADFIDSSSIFLLGTRMQNLYSNGISRSSRSTSLINDGYGAPVIPNTPVIAYLLNTGINSSPFDDINFGDDIIEFKPSAGDISSNSFDEKFALVKIGDVLRINYGSVEVQFIIKEKKYIQSGGNKKYIVRINGKNLFYSVNAVARIDKPLFNNNKYGVLAVAPANNTFSEVPSLIVGNPRGAQALGIGFNPDQLNGTHYFLYLALYPTGSPADGYTILPAIDVTGNRGTTPGQYTLESVVEATNNSFRKVGYNYRFIAFSYQGEFGIMLADSYGNSGFSILSGIVASDGTYDEVETSVNFQKNVVDVFPDAGTSAIDALGFGTNGSNYASPPYQSSYGSAEAALLPTKIFLPLKRNNYYVNGIEKEKLTLEVNQLLDTYGDGYWDATVHNVNIFPGPSGRVQVTYRVLLDLSTSNLKAGKTVVVQSAGEGNLVDYGRFIIENITFLNPCPTPADAYTDITVYDAVHATGISPSPTLAIGGKVALYFNSDSVSFNKESATDFTNVSPFKRFFEVYIDQNGHTFTHERGRIGAGSSTTINGIPLLTFSELIKLNIVKISSKLRGYQFGSVNKITLNMISYNDATGTYVGNLASYDGITLSHNGPITTGKKGQVTRFYDETNIDFIDVIFDINTVVSDFSNQFIDFQLFPTLSLDEEIMLIGTCQLNDTNNTVNFIKDERQFGNISEKDLSTSALNFISLPEKLLHTNGVIRGFDLQDKDTITNPNNDQIYLNGGVVLVNGKIIPLNNETVNIPIIKENFGFLHDVNWLLCANDKGEYQPIPLLDFDSSLGTPDDSTRLFKAFNAANGLNYNLDATTFSNVVNKRKDLTPLYIVSSTVSTLVVPATISLSLTDVRKYVNDADSNLPLKLTSAEAQGNFKNIESIFNWIKYNNQFNSLAIVKGANGTSGTISSPTTLDFANTVIIDGEKDALLTFNNIVTFGSNVNIKNCDIIFNDYVFFNSNCQNILIENCDITINVPASSPASNIIFNISGGTNITIRNCNITAQYTSAFGSGFVFRGSVFKLNNSSNFKLDNTNIVTNYVIVPGTITPGNVFTLTNSNYITIIDSSLSGNFNKCLDISTSSNIKLYNSNVTSTYNPSADSYNGIAYDSSNLVNSGQGYIYSNISGLLSDIDINNVVFNYNPSSNTNNRYSFINFELSYNSAILKNVNITNCKFNNLSIVGPSTDDYRAAISIINTTPFSLFNTTKNQQPILLNANITNNICNRNQSIIITSKFDSNSNMVYPGISCQNCHIEKNICGSIGYWVSSGAKYTNVDPNVNQLTEREFGLNINSNNCHLIVNVDSKGKHFLLDKLVLGVSTNSVSYATGHVSINNNTINWIFSGISYEDNSSLKIINNTLSSYDINYLSNFGIDTSAIFANYAIFIGSNKHTASNSQNPGEGNNSSCIISNNTTNTGYWKYFSSSPISYNYSLGYIYSQSSCNIHNNILKGVSETFNQGKLILLGGNDNIVTHNKIYRNTKSIFAYIAFENYDSTLWDGAGSNGIVTENFFDSPYTNEVDNNELLVNLTNTSVNTTRWIVERNINQTNTLYLCSNQGSQRFSLAGSSRVIAGDTPAGFSISVNSTGPGDLDSVKSKYIGPTVSGRINYEWNLPLSSILPINTFVTYVTFTIASDRVFATTGFVQSVLYKSNSTTNLILNQSPSGDFTTSVGPYTLEISDSTSPNVISPFNNFINTGTHDVGLYIITSQEDAVSTITVSLSPITIKYRW